MVDIERVKNVKDGHSTHVHDRQKLRNSVLTDTCKPEDEMEMYIPR